MNATKVDRFASATAISRSKPVFQYDALNLLLHVNDDNHVVPVNMCRTIGFWDVQLVVPMCPQRLQTASILYHR